MQYYKSSYSFAFVLRPTVHLISPFGLVCGAYTSASLPVFFRPLCQLKSATNNGLAGAQDEYIYQRDEIHTNFKVVLVRQRVLDRLKQGLTSQDLLRHLVHSVLDTGRVVLGKGLKGDIPGRRPGRIELRHSSAHLFQPVEAAPLPAGVDVGAENTVPCLREGGVLVAQEAPELRVGALQNGQLGQRRSDVHALALDDIDLHVAGFLAIPEEGVRVRLAVDGHTGPTVGDDVDMGGVDVVVLGDEVGSKNGTKELGRSDGVLLGSDVDGVLDGVGCDNHAVVGLGVAVVNEG